MEKINEIVANNIAILRKKNRLSLEELGKLSGVSKSRERGNKGKLCEQPHSEPHSEGRRPCDGDH